MLQILSAEVRGVQISELSEAVEMRFRTLARKHSVEPACNFWNVTLEVRIDVHIVAGDTSTFIL